MINKRLKDVLFTDQWSEVCMERLSPFGYVLVSHGFLPSPHMHPLPVKCSDKRRFIPNDISAPCSKLGSFCCPEQWTEGLFLTGTICYLLSHSLCIISPLSVSPTYLGLRQTLQHICFNIYTKDLKTPVFT